MISVSIGIPKLSVRAAYLGSTADTYAVEGYSPTTVLDFENEFYRVNGSTSDFGSAVTFSRASGATYVDSNGVLQTVLADVPRIGHHVYEGGQWVNKGLLKEGAATNLQPSSSDISDTNSWTLIVNAGVQPVGSGSLSNQIVAPDGTLTGDFVAEISGGGLHYWYGPVYNTSGTRVWSIYLKAGSRTEARIQLGARSMGKGVAADIDLAAGTITDPIYVGGTYTALKSGIIDCGNGWFRCYISATCPAESYVGYVTMRSNGSVSYSGNGSGLYQWGAQMEEGSLPSSYIPTNGSQATRAADVITIPAGTLGWPTGGALSLAMNGEVSYAGRNIFNDVVFLDWRLAANTYISINLDTNSSRTGNVDFLMLVGGAVSRTEADVLSPSLSTPFKLCGTYSDTFIAAAVNGSSLATSSTTTALPDLSATEVELLPTFNGTVKSLSYWPEDISDAGRLGAST